VNLDPDPDIVEVILRACQASGLDADAALLIEAKIRADYGGLRVRIPKRKKHLSPEERERAYSDSLSAMSNEEICSKHGISRSSLYRLVKRGPDK
jgi:DNA invertase Pin-like site-specific DNA recombinase